MNDKEVEAEPGDRRRDPDLGRAEPILELAAIEHQLQGANRQTQRGEAEEVEWLAVGAPRLADKDQDAERRSRPHRQVDVEQPAPVVIIGQPSAERWTD